MCHEFTISGIDPCGRLQWHVVGDYGQFPFQEDQAERDTIGGMGVWGWGCGGRSFLNKEGTQ